MQNTHNITITLLIVTAAALTSLLVGSYLYTEPAYGAISSAKGGDYILTSGSLDADRDLIYVLDIAVNKLNVYYADINTNSVVFGDSVDLGKAFTP